MTAVAENWYRRDGLGCGNLQLDDFAGGSPPTPRRHHSQFVERVQTNVLTIDNGKNYHGTSRSSGDVDEHEDGSNTAFDEIDHVQRNLRQLQTIMETMTYGSHQHELRQNSMSED